LNAMQFFTKSCIVSLLLTFTEVTIFYENN